MTETVVIRLKMMQNYHQAYIKLQWASPTLINMDPNTITLRGAREWHPVFYKRIENTADNDQYQKGISAGQTAPVNFFQKGDEKYGEGILEFVMRAGAITLKPTMNQRKLKELFYFMAALFFIRNCRGAGCQMEDYKLLN